MSRREDIAARLLASLGQAAAPPETADLATDLIARCYGLEGVISPLTGERDSNFRLTTDAGDFVFKIFGPGSPPDEPHLLSHVLRFLAERAADIPVPRLRQPNAGADFVRFTDGSGRARFAIMYSYLPGRPLMETERMPAQRVACGQLLARLGLALRDFTHPFMLRPLIWDLRHLPVLREVNAALRSRPFDRFVTPFLEDYASLVVQPLARLPHQFVHNDLNARNVIIDIEAEGQPAGVIDFGDAIYTARLCDVAVGVIGQLHSAPTAAVSTQDFLDSYGSISPLKEEEEDLLPWLVAGRIVQNLIMTSYYRERVEASEHFDAFGPDYFAWRIDFAERLVRFALPAA